MGHDFSEAIVTLNNHLPQWRSVLRFVGSKMNARIRRGELNAYEIEALRNYVAVQMRRLEIAEAALSHLPNAFLPVRAPIAGER